MESAARTFEAKTAERGQVPLIIGLMGASGCGKTYSALELATGFQKASGGEIYVIDTEARRALHYADRFKFKHVEFAPPFSPMDYLAAIEYCHKKGAKHIVIDSMSHEHEGQGGVLEMHDKMLQKLSGGDYEKAKRVGMLAWSEPKQARDRLRNRMLQIDANFICCFRAKEKIKPDAKEKSGIRELGWQAIGAIDYVYEMMTCFLLYPGSNGVPTWVPQHPDETRMFKLPEQFKGLFAKPASLSRSHGEVMKRWADGATIEQAIAAAKGKTQAEPAKANLSVVAPPREFDDGSVPPDQEPPEPGSEG